MPNVGGCILGGTARLSMGPHPDRARADSELIVMHVLQRNRAWLMAHGGDEVSEDACGRLQEIFERRSRGEPMQYIIGECEFYGLPFKVTRDVLIPRPETEHLVEKAIEASQGFERPRIVDVGTGSGAIAVALAHQLRDAGITATDLSAAALAVARENARRNAVVDRVRFLEGDLMAPVSGEQFEMVVSNPPYVANKDCALMTVEVREYEPALALFAGDEGLEVYRRLIPAAYAALVPGGFFGAEMGFSQAGDVESLLAGAGFVDVEFVRDLQGIPRVASARRP